MQDATGETYRPQYTPKEKEDANKHMLDPKAVLFAQESFCVDYQSCWLLRNRRAEGAWTGRLFAEVINSRE
jgi:hypothetical protein